MYLYTDHYVVEARQRYAPPPQMHDIRTKRMIGVDTVRLLYQRVMTREPFKNARAREAIVWS